MLLGTLQWVVTGYLLALALMLPLSGWLVDRLGAKRVYLGCFTLFTIASLLCGLSSSAGSLIAARVLQGIAGGLLAPLAQMMVAREAPRHIARVMGVMVVPVLLGPIFGPSLAGLILQHASWHWIFYINLPIGVLAIALAAFMLPDDRGTGKLRTFDSVGFLLISPGLVLLLYSLDALGAKAGTSRFATAGEVIVAVILLSGFVVHAAREGAAALIDLRLFKDPAFSAAAMTQFLANAISYGGQILLPLLFLTVLRISPVRAGVLLAVTGLGALVSFPSVGAITEHFGARWVSAVGACLVLLGTLPFAFLPPASLSMWMICGALFLRGVGLGAISVPLIAVAYSSLPRETVPVATTALNIVQRMGGPIATTILTLYLHARSAPLLHEIGTTSTGTDRTFASTFQLLCLFNVLAVLSALRLPLRAGQAAEVRAREYRPAMEPIVE